MTMIVGGFARKFLLKPESPVATHRPESPRFQFASPLPRRSCFQEISLTTGAILCQGNMEIDECRKKQRCWWEPQDCGRPLPRRLAGKRRLRARDRFHAPAARAGASAVDRDDGRFRKLAEMEPFPSADVFCALGTTIAKAGSQHAFLKVDSNTRTSLPSAARLPGLSNSTGFLGGADPKSSNFYLRVKAELEKAVNARPFESVHISGPAA